MLNKKIIIANWKMNLSIRESGKLAQRLKLKFKNFKKSKIVVCPDFVSLGAVAKILKGSKISLGAQDVYKQARGAYTGEVSPKNLAEIGCKYVIIGHSDRRRIAGQSDQDINDKIKTTLEEKIIPIVCVGETKEERQSNRWKGVVARQLQIALKGLGPVDDDLIITYEPVWAISTNSGLVISSSQAEEAHRFVRDCLIKTRGVQKAKKIKIIYGGSVNEKNIKQFDGLENIDGFLIGGASLNSKEFYKIAEQAC